MSDDPYLYSGTETLKNRFGVQDPKALAKIERTVTAARMRQPMKTPPALTPQGFQQTHKHIFQDVYPWAGTIRTVRMDKGGSRFCMPQHIDAQMRATFAELQKEQGLRGLAPDAFAARAALHISELNAIHPFREGNGRAQRLFLQQMARQAGHELDQTRLDPRRWIDSSIRSFHEGPEGDHSQMAKTIREALIQERIRIQDQGARSRERGKTKAGQPKSAPTTPTKASPARSTPSAPSMQTASSTVSKPNAAAPSGSARLRAEFAEMKARQTESVSPGGGGSLAQTTTPAKGPSRSRLKGTAARLHQKCFFPDLSTRQPADACSVCTDNSELWSTKT